MKKLLSGLRGLFGSPSPVGATGAAASPASAVSPAAFADTTAEPTEAGPGGTPEAAHAAAPELANPATPSTSTSTSFEPTLHADAPARPAVPVVLVNAYATRRVVPPLDFPHVLHARRDRSDAALAPHLDGFAGYVGAQGDGQMTTRRFHVLRHIGRVQQHLSLSVANDQLDAFAGWAQAANAIAYLPDGSVRDPGGRILVAHGTGAIDTDSAVPYPHEAVARKDRTHAALAERGWVVAPHLPPREGESEVEARAVADVWGRVCALAMVALRAESARDGEPLSTALLHERLPAGVDALSPRERAFLEQATPSAADIARFGWSSEAMLVMAWALGLVDALPFPAAPCDAGAVTQAVLSACEAAPPRRIVRTTSELLDALDTHYRLAWRLRQSRLDGQDTLPGLDTDVVQERYLASTWLVSFPEIDWDDVETPT